MTNKLLKKEYSYITYNEYKDLGKLNITSLYKFCSKGYKVYLDSDIQTEDDSTIIRLYDIRLINNDSLLTALLKHSTDSYSKYNPRRHINELVYDDKFFNEYKDCYGNGIENNKDNQLDIIIKEFTLNEYHTVSKFIHIYNPEIWKVKDLLKLKHAYKEFLYITFNTD